MLAELSASGRIVAETIAGLLDIDEADLTMDRELAGLDGWDSVNALRVLVFLERCSEASLDFERFSQARRLADLADLVAEAADGTVAQP